MLCHQSRVALHALDVTGRLPDRGFPQFCQREQRDVAGLERENSLGGFQTYFQFVDVRGLVTNASAPGFSTLRGGTLRPRDR